MMVYNHSSIFLKMISLITFFSKSQKKVLDYGYFGTYSNWADAMADSSGYQDPQIAAIVSEGS